MRHRGLINRDNKCFLNVVLQSLVSCPPFFHFLTAVAYADLPEAQFPTLSRFVKLREEFAVPVVEAKGTGPWKSIPTITPILPSYFYDLLKKFNPIATGWQEDSQEFLSFLLDAMNDEISLVTPQKPGTSSLQSAPSEDWEEVGKGNKSAVVLTERGLFKKSVITDIFGGEMKSIVRKKGLKASASLQPFFCLHLDVLDDRVSTVEDAIGLYMSSEVLEGFTSNNKDIQASKQITIERLPRVLILHLKRFDFGLFGSEKKQTTPEQRTYSLFVVINHIGSRAIGGHYTCDIRQTDGGWLRHDDATVSPVSPEQVFNNQAYVLMYIVNSE